MPGDQNLLPHPVWHLCHTIFYNLGKVSASNALTERLQLAERLRLRDDNSPCKCCKHALANTLNKKREHWWWVCVNSVNCLQKLLHRTFPWKYKYVIRHDWVFCKNVSSENKCLKPPKQMVGTVMLTIKQLYTVFH